MMMRHDSMTDEERKKLCAELGDKYYGSLGRKAADEIEWLVEENRKLKQNLDYAWRRIEAETGAVE
jgi:hypothetical protein